MRVAFVHYHVKSGGVTRVMENAAQALSIHQDGFDAVVLCGHEIPDNCRLPARVVEGLGYSERRIDPVVLADRMEQSAIDFLGGPPDIWHIHNHSLGKNPSMVDAVVELANRGRRIVLQVHDFAEDGRPSNYRLRESHVSAPSSFPVCKHLHYVVLNRRDYDVLKGAGIPESQLHWLPNPVVVPTIDYDESDSFEHALDELVVYPVRAVRRKNLGEMLLHAALPSKRKSYVTTLGTTSLDFVNEYEQWKNFSQEIGLHVTFEVCQSLGFSFDLLIDQSNMILTTSVAEGFGLGFVEPWVFGKSLIGRDLPEITTDFKDLGIQFSHLYTSLDIPISVFRFDEFRSRLDTMASEYHKKYGIEHEKDWLNQWVSSSVKNLKIDFAKLDEIAQREVIEEVQANYNLQSDLHSHFQIYNEQAHVINENASIIETELSIDKYGERLQSIYDELVDSGVGSSIEFADGNAVLNAFFSVERFLPLRT